MDELRRTVGGRRLIDMAEKYNIYRVKGSTSGVEKAVNRILQTDSSYRGSRAILSLMTTLTKILDFISIAASGAVGDVSLQSQGFFLWGRHFR